MAYLLSCTRKSTGALTRAAQLSASWKAPWLVAPSPEEMYVTASSPRRCVARANPTPGMYCAPTDELVVMMLSSLLPKCSDIWRPPEFTSSAFAMWASIVSRAVIPSVRVRARSR